MNQSSPQRSALDKLVQENERLRENLNDIRAEKEEILKSLRKLQTENKVYEMKTKTVEAEREKDLAENKKFMQALEQERKDKFALLTELTQIKNSLARKDAEIASIKSSNQGLVLENQRLTHESETWRQEKINNIREKQNATNSVKILETKLQASEMQKKFQTNRSNQLQLQLTRVKQQLSEVSKKYHERQIGVQAIYKDEEATKKRLLEQFQNKITDKDNEMKNQLQKYLNENAVLKQQLIELRNARN